jgi:hypothetical protein
MSTNSSLYIRDIINPLRRKTKRMKAENRIKKVWSVELNENIEALNDRIRKLNEIGYLPLNKKIEALTRELSFLRMTEPLTQEIEELRWDEVLTHHIKKLRKSEFDCDVQEFDRDVQEFTRRVWNARITKVEHKLHLPINRHTPAAKLVKLLDQEAERLVTQKFQTLEAPSPNYYHQYRLLPRKITRLQHQKKWFLIETWATENDIDSETLFGRCSSSRKRRIRTRSQLNI